jgi:hypothetical protein
VRFPFGRGARQREIDGLRQRIAELQDEITKVEESLLAESPDVETTDAYRSVQLLRESMRREELTTLRQDLGGLEARLKTLTADRQPPAAAAELESATETETVAEPAGRGSPDSGTEGAIEPGMRSDEPPLGPEASAPPLPVSGHGLPSERAIIEPSLPARAPAESAPPSEEGVEAVSSATVDDQPPPVVEEAPVAAGATGDAELADTLPVTDLPATDLVEEEPTAVTVEPDGEPGATEPGTAEPGTVEPVATAADGGTGIGVVEDSVAEAPAEAEPADEAEAVAAVPQGRSHAGVLLAVLLLLAVVAIVAVAAFEGGLIGPVIGTSPTLAPARPTLSTVVPTLPPPTVRPTVPPTRPPEPTAPPLARAIRSPAS